MDAVKIYWENPIFLIGMFLCLIGTLITIGGFHNLGVWSSLTGFAIITISIYRIEVKNLFE
jgi:hypothetical protein